ncbi:hypothetical protein SELMODRAFT_417597 [Selaginella moellendorffii]|uniref:EF-hand domain-containing protein n=1 Tax=Selaginella moellendorffii TaxID=88036 RepID=D8S2Z1_SELML|nr:hypothetical protein SELMODRAFT_417597 [Selaginella moellendorffii]
MAILQAGVWLDKPHDIRDKFIWQRKDRNKDGMVFWAGSKHYHQSYYNACDENGDGVLNWVEFKNCLNPERIKGNNGRKLQMWLYNVQDANKDGKIDFSEFSQAFVYYHHNNFCTHREPNNETEIFMRFNSVEIVMVS